MKKGDCFIFYGKSGVVKGVVADTFEKATYDLNNGVRVITPYITSTDGEKYNEKHCLKIDSEIRPSFLRRLLNLIKT